MKTKKKTYVLLVLVITVWGTVAYKIISALNPELPEIHQQEFATNSNYKIKIKVDTFSITQANRDPFLGTYINKPLKDKPKTIVTVKWKPIVYQGIIEKGTDKMFIVSINNQQYLMRKGQSKDSTTLLYGNSKKITMRFRNHSKTFYLNKKQ